MFKRARLTLTDSPRPPAPPGAWAPPSAYSGYGAQQQQVFDDRHDNVYNDITLYKKGNFEYNLLLNIQYPSRASVGMGSKVHMGEGHHPNQIIIISK